MFIRRRFAPILETSEVSSKETSEVFQIAIAIAIGIGIGTGISDLVPIVCLILWDGLIPVGGAKHSH